MQIMDDSARASNINTVQVQRRLTITDHTLDDFNLQQHCSLGLARPGSTAVTSSRSRPHAQAGLGHLDSLPCEVLTEILLLLSIRGLSAFKQVNTSAVGFVDSLPRYSAIRRQYPDILRAAIGIRADSFSCNTLYETLTTSGCATCSRSGNYIYLITCVRVCCFCFLSHRDYMPVSSTKAAKMTNLSIAAVKKQLPFIHSVPGRYGSGSRKYLSRKLLFDRQAVLRAGVAESGVYSHTEPVGDHFSFTRADSQDPIRYMAVIVAPYMSSKTEPVDWGFYCHSCAEAQSKHPLTDFRNHYTATSITEHIDEYHPGATLQVIPDRDRARPWVILE